MVAHAARQRVPWLTSNVEMEDPTQDVESKIRMAFIRAEPTRHFCRCKIAGEGDRIFVRVYSQRRDSKPVMPVPYQVFRFDSVSGVLAPASKDEVAHYTIPSYK